MSGLGISQPARTDRKRPRTKTFTGCWTCRARRVKCDEHKPRCQRCRQADIPCEGYGARLHWLTTNNPTRDSPDSSHNEGPSKARAPRRSAGRMVSALATPRMSSPEIDALLERIDGDPLAWRGVEGDVFSVFSVRMAEPRVLETPPDSGHEFHEENESPAPSDRDMLEPPCAPPLRERPEDTALAMRPGPCRPSRAEASAFQPAAESEIFQLRPSPTQTDPGENLPPQSIVSTDTSSEPPTPTAHQTPSPDLLRQLHRAPYPPPTHLDLLQMPSTQRRLLHHWVTFTSRNLVLLDEAHNPCRAMMLPMALRGLTSPSASSTADIATFHAICACAAFNLYELSGRSREDDRLLALRHDQEATRHLRHNLAQADTHRDQSFAMAIMACITIEAISGTTGRWRTHVGGGLAYLSKLLRGLPPGGRAGVVEFQSHMVSMGIMCGCEVEQDLTSFLSSAENLELSFPYYGASSAFLRNMDYMNSVIRSGTMPPQRELDAFELTLYLGFPAPGTARASLPKTHALMVHHMAQAYYYASLVFFQRCVRRQPLESVQALVGSGVAQLEAIEEVSGGEAGSVMMWPALVLAAECGGKELQGRMTGWFEAKRRLGFGNIVVVREMVGALWEGRERGDEGTGWLELIAQDRFDVFRL